MWRDFSITHTLHGHSHAKAVSNPSSLSAFRLICSFFLFTNPLNCLFNYHVLVFATVVIIDLCFYSSSLHEDNMLYLKHSQLTCLSWNIDGFISLDKGQRMVRFEEHDFSLFSHLERLSLKFNLHFLHWFFCYQRSLMRRNIFTACANM